MDKEVKNAFNSLKFVIICERDKRVPVGGMKMDISFAFCGYGLSEIDSMFSDEFEYADMSHFC